MIISSCQKVVNHPIEDENLITASTYKAGSFFVYTDSITGFKDSFTTRGTTNYLYNVDKYTNYIENRCDFSGDYVNHNFFFETSPGGYLRFFYGDSIVSIAGARIYSPNDSGYIYGVSNKNAYIENLKEFVLNGTTYTNVQLFVGISDNSIYRDTFISYFSRDIGLLKFSSFTKDYHCVKELTNHLSLK